MSVSRVILNSKAQYARAYLYTELDGNDLTYFVLYNLKCIRQALDDLKKYIQRKTEEKKNVMQMLRYSFFNERQIALLQEMNTEMTGQGEALRAELEQWGKSLSEQEKEAAKAERAASFFFLSIFNAVMPLPSFALKSAPFSFQ